ncbi:MAG: hypothetical protein LBB84_03230 [Tannerellaceae bacterium]|jgi:hypothetical protein|nr:hypothetical protein [Tannerellaceae bacterium]
MTKDLAFFPAWYAEKGDYVFVDEETLNPFLSQLPVTIQPVALPLTRKEIKEKASLLPPMEVCPWGMSRPVIYLFNQLKQKYGLPLNIPPWKDEYTWLINRRTAAGCLTDIQRQLPEMTFPTAPVFFSETEEIETYLHRHTGSFVLKTPYSSSGRGLLWLEGNRLNDNDRRRIKRILQKQKTLSLERVLDKELDFALEFYSDGKGNIRYEGISLFNTNSRGAYQGNKLQAQSALRERLSACVGEEEPNNIRQAVAHALSHTFGIRHTGYIGVDMLVYKENESFRIHPCVEINLRYTMGMAAIRIFENYFDKNATGLLHILYEKETGRAYEQHRRMEKTYPPIHENGKLQKGYLSLCPVTEDTNYIAYILAT